MEAMLADRLGRQLWEPANEQEEQEIMNRAWLIFWSSFIGLAVFDLCCLAPKSGAGTEVSGSLAIIHCCFWFLIGLGFNGIVLFLFDHEMAMVWFDGYILEYLLSVDNVFFFHVVFQAYATPSSQMYKALFLGILGAVVLRLVFYFIGGGVFRLAFAFQVVFGLVLIYSGYKTATTDDDDEDPREMKCVQIMTRMLPLTDSYDEKAALFVWGSGRASSVAQSSPPAQVVGVVVEDGFDEATKLTDPTQAPNLHTVGKSVVAARADNSICKLRGTMLLLVVLVLQVVDLIFAVDSVTAKIAEYDNVFLNFSSSAFAMLCLRSMYFVLTRLLKYFRFLKYGVALILVLIGVKLIVAHWIEVPSIYSLGTICSVFILSMVLSCICPAPDDDEQEESSPAAAAKAEAATGALGAGNIEAASIAAFEIGDEPEGPDMESPNHSMSLKASSTDHSPLKVSADHSDVF